MESSDLRDLYQQVILDHYRKPRNFRGVPGADRRAEGFNPLCGDRIKVELRIGPDGVIEDAAFTGAGCAICTASASMMTESVRGRSTADAEGIFEGFHRLVTTEADTTALQDRLGTLTVFDGVREFPVRIKCATLPWHTFHAAVAGRGEPVTTE